MLADDRVNGFFDDADVESLRAHQVKFISAVAGGPVEYTGDDMRGAHAHLDISEEEFRIVADHLEAALADCGVAAPDREAIVDEVDALEDPVVGR